MNSNIWSSLKSLFCYAVVEDINFNFILAVRNFYYETSLYRNNWYLFLIRVGWSEYTWLVKTLPTTHYNKSLIMSGHQLVNLVNSKASIVPCFEHHLRPYIQNMLSIAEFASQNEGIQQKELFFTRKWYTMHIKY